MESERRTQFYRVYAITEGPIDRFVGDLVFELESELEPDHLALQGLLVKRHDLSIVPSLLLPQSV